MIVAIGLVTGVLMLLGLLARRPVPTVVDLPAVGAVHGGEEPPQDLVAESRSKDPEGPKP